MCVLGIERKLGDPWLGRQVRRPSHAAAARLLERHVRSQLGPEDRVKPLWP